MTGRGMKRYPNILLFILCLLMFEIARFIILPNFPPIPVIENGGVYQNMRSDECRHRYSTTDGEFLQFHIKLKQEPAYIFSAFHTKRYKEHPVVISGASHRDIKFDCCFVDKYGLLYTENVSASIQRGAGGAGRFDHFLPMQYICPYHKARRPKLVSLVSANRTCPELACQNYLPILTPDERPGKVAICVPFLFGGISESHIIEFMEYYKLLGVHKVYLYYLHDQQNIMNLLARYQEDGFVEIIMGDFPGVLRGHANRIEIFTKSMSPQYDADLQYGANDCIERTAGYSYVIMYDLDEFLVPSNGSFRIWELLEMLNKEYPNAAGFQTVNKILPLQWNESHPSSKIERMKYRRIAADPLRAPKTIHIPNRTERRNVHRIHPREGYSVPVVPEKYATIYHYRVCNIKNSCDKSTSKIETRLDAIADQWYTNIQAMKKRLMH